MSASGYVHLDVEEVVGEFDKALLLQVEGYDEPIWFPKSQVADADDYKKGDKNCSVSITEWIAKQKGIET